MTLDEMDFETMLILIGARDVGLVKDADSCWGFAMPSTFDPDFSSEDVDFLVTSGLLSVKDNHAVLSPAGLELLHELEEVNGCEFSCRPSDEALN